MSNILVLGASRGIGLETVKAALASGHSVRAFSRDAMSIPLTDVRLEKLNGDATDAADVERAVAGTDAVVMALGVKSPFSTTPITLFSKATRHVVASMTKLGIRRLIVVTGFGAGDSRGMGNFWYANLMFPLLLSRIYEDKDVQEDFVRKSGLDWTILRPGILTNGPATGAVRALVEKKDWRLGRISRADVAAFIVTELATRGFVGKTPALLT